ncbi:hypothetical protein FH968_22455 [Buttiauxella sp. B2]|uniref:hypothetical protein n=1 Tax=Buttiauxella sp. B2 TaxID=2587812 RepID=UPI00111FB84B|nr:hypothetical protein [Buttiauxella sp. B2]TNV11486.1 hypothetical protein FH968_22455 [Buttiauxella sp. B2]
MILRLISYFFFVFSISASANILSMHNSRLLSVTSGYQILVDAYQECDPVTFVAKNDSYGIDCRVHTSYNGTSGVSPVGCYYRKDIKAGDVVNFPGCSQTTNNMTLDVIVNPTTDPGWYMHTTNCLLLVSNYLYGKYDNEYDYNFCVYTPPTPVDISCIASDIRLDHQTVSVGDYDGSEVKAHGSVTCKNGDASVVLSFANPTVNLSNGTQSILTFDDANSTSNTESIETAVDVPSDFIVKSTLSGTPVIPGEFSGSTVLIIDII